jgi:prophage antirepressor-like protein
LFLFRKRCWRRDPHPRTTVPKQLLKSKGHHMPEQVPAVFKFEGAEFQVHDRGGNPWWVLADVCRVLEIGNPSQAASRLDDEEKHTLTTNEGDKINGLGTVGAMPTIINESGLYSLILRSRKPAAKRFKKWVTAEVLPAIRKTGSYVGPAAELSADNRSIIGGINRAVITKALAPIQAQVTELKAELRAVVAGFDPAQSVVTNYQPMLTILKASGVEPTARRALSQQCSSRMRRWLINSGRGDAVRSSRETGRYLFHVDAARDWLSVEGRALIGDHKARISGQGSLPLTAARRGKKKAA